MKNTITISLGMLFMTIAYCWLIWLGFGFYSFILPVEAGATLPFITRLTVLHGLPFPYHALPWQLLAVLSLLLNLYRIFREDSIFERRKDIALPLACHASWIIFSLCCHGIGMLTPYVSFASVLVR